MTEPVHRRWYALMVRARQERAAAEDLARRQVEVFSATQVERRSWSDRVRDVEVALFPGYLFVRVAMSSKVRVELLKTRQAVELVGRLPGDPAIARAIPDDEMAALQGVVLSCRELDPVARLMPGVPVLVAAGPLRGVRGVIELPADGRRRLVVQIRLLGRGVRTTLHVDDVLEELGLAA